MWETVYNLLRKAALLSGSLFHTFFACLAFLAGFSTEWQASRLFTHGVQEGSIGELLSTMEPPLYLPGLICAFLLGCIVYFLTRSVTTSLAWLLPAAILAWNMLIWRGSSVWDTFFGSECGNTECLYQTFITVPFYASGAYSLGAVVVLVFVKHKFLASLTW